LKSKIIYRVSGWFVSSIIGINRIIPIQSSIKEWVKLRQTPVTQGLSSQNEKLNILFICPSLGEYESIKPVISAVRSSSNIHLSFFSDSGYSMLKKEPSLWSTLSYTPIDQYSKVQRYLDEINPDRIVIAHNFMWPNLLRVIIEREIRLYLIELTIDRSRRLKLLWAALWRPTFDHASLITTSDQGSFEYFREQQNLSNVKLTESLRYLSALNYADSSWKDKLIEKFCNRRPTLILGSAHREDIEIFAPIYVELIKTHQLLIVPHYIDDETIAMIRNHIGRSMTYSLIEEIADDPILIVDQIGILKYLYRYASIAYIGGGFGRGIHNAQEAVPYGVPIIFGPNYQKFAYAQQLIKERQAYSITTSSELQSTVSSLASVDSPSLGITLSKNKLERDIQYIANAIID